jgi:hemolysin D
VLSVSRDAIARDRALDKGDAAPEDDGAPRISLDRTRMRVEENLASLSPGMAVIVEIKTGARTIISYLLSLLVRYRHESLRER